MWSPAGGWWANPRHWKRNTALGYCFIGTCLMFTFSYSAANEVRPAGPKQLRVRWGWGTGDAGVPARCWAHRSPVASRERLERADGRDRT